MADRLRFPGGMTLVVCGLLLAVAPVRGQYREGREYQPSETRFLSLGFFQRSFRPMASNPLDDSMAIAYERFMPVLGLRQGPVDIMLGYTRFRLRGISREAVFLAAAYRQELPLSGEAGERLVLPLLLSTDFTKAQAAGAQRETFGVASLGIGTGVKFRSIGAGHDASIELLGVAHYSFDGLGTGSGFSPAMIAEASLLLPDALSFTSLVLGYRLRVQSWSMSEEKFNYRSLSHGPYLGVVF
jgi:hypothetical protein